MVRGVGGVLAVQVDLWHECHFTACVLNETGLDRVGELISCAGGGARGPYSSWTSGREACNFCTIP